MISYTIKISNLGNNTTWETSLDDSEFYSLMEDSDVKRNLIDIIPASFIPIRTDTLINFTKDFFLPTTVNHAIKVQHTVGKVFAILASLVLDLLTFPLRLVTCIPRAIENARREEHPLHKYLIDQAVDPKLLEAGYVRTKFTIKTHYQVQGHLVEKEEWGSYNVNFIELPIYDHYGHLDHCTTMKGNERPSDSKPLTIST